MDDVTSGFNIAGDISLEPEFSSMAGFTEEEVERLFHYYRPSMEQEESDETLRGLMREWYGGYHFSMEEEPVYNPDMILYFISKCRRYKGKVPEYLIDRNVRIDYSKLRFLLLAEKKLNGNFSLLENTLADNGLTGAPVDSFTLAHLTARRNFASILYYFGLVTRGGTREVQSWLRIPNRTMKEFLAEYLREGWREVEAFQVDVRELTDLIFKAAYRGDWRALFDFLAEELRKQTKIRDYLDGEKVVQTFLLAYLYLVDVFVTESEREAEKGCADLFLQPFFAKYPDCRYGYLIEVKYLSKTEDAEGGQSAREEKIEAAKAQLAQYSGDAGLQRLMGAATLKRLVVVFRGWEIVYCEEYEG